MSYIDEKSLEEFSKCVVTLVEENTADNENIFTDSYCKSTCNAYLNKTYTADTFPFRYHINDNNNIYIDGISVAGISDNSFDKINITINSKYTIDGTEYTVTGVGDYGLAVTDEKALKNAGLADDAVKKFSKSNDENDVLFYCNSITLPLTVNHLGDNAFANLGDLSTGRYYQRRKLAYITGIDNVSDITGTSTFSNCSNLKTVYLPRLNTLVTKMFSSDTALTDVCFGEITQIPDECFIRCFRLSNITKYDNSAFNITSIGVQSFNRTIALDNFDFDILKVKSVGAEAFLFCNYTVDWQAMIDNGCTFGIRATKYQLWNNTSILSHKFNFTPCMNTNGKNYALMQSYIGWKNIPLGNSTDKYFGKNGCSWMSAAMAHNILSGQSLTPVQFNNLVANSADGEKANMQLMPNYNDTDSITIGSLVELPWERFESIESIQGIYDGLARGYIYNVYMTAIWNITSWEVTGAHALLVVGVDETGKWVCAESNYAGPNRDLPTSGLMHIDPFTWFTDRINDNANHPFNWVNKLTYNPNYKMKG